MLGGLTGVVRGLFLMLCGGPGVMRRLLEVAFFVEVRGFLLVTRRVMIVRSCLAMMGCCIGHVSNFPECDSIKKRLPRQPATPHGPRPQRRRVNTAAIASARLSRISSMGDSAGTHVPPPPGPPAHAAMFTLFVSSVTAPFRASALPIRPVYAIGRRRRSLCKKRHT